MKLKNIAAAAVLSAAMPGGVVLADPYTYTGLAAPSAIYTTPRGINDSGVVVGRSGPNDSFSEAGGVFTNIDIPGAARTVARGINDAGAVVGFYKPAGPGGVESFVQSGAGLATFDFAGADATQGLGINDAGSVVGGYSVGGVQHAFEFVGGVASEIQIAGSSSTLATGINNSGDIVGYYTNADGDTIGFIDRNGVITNLSVPGAAVTQPLGINNLGEIVGDYILTPSGSELPFAKIGNIYNLLNVPPSIFTGATVTDATGVNDTGAIAGYVGVASTNDLTGYLATPVAGSPIDIALQGGDATAPTIVPVAEIHSILGAIGGGVTSQFYSFSWSGGLFGADLDVAGVADPATTYEFELCAGSTCGSALSRASLGFANGWSNTIADNLDAGIYTIGLIEGNGGPDPDFTLSFHSAISSPTPEPATWAMLLVGFLGVGAAVRGHRRPLSSTVLEFDRIRASPNPPRIPACPTAHPR